MNEESSILVFDLNFSGETSNTKNIKVEDIKKGENCLKKFITKLFFKTNHN